jgi:uncharacterized protein YjbI with pentapeptide repeats
MLTELLTNLAASFIYDFSKDISGTEMKASLPLFLEGIKSSKNDFYRRYLEALIELRVEGKGKEVLNFFKEEGVFQAFYCYYYGCKDFPILDENQLQEKLNHCIASLKVGDDIYATGRDPGKEIFYFREIFKQKIHESRSLRDIEPMPRGVKSISKYHQEKAASYFSSCEIDEKIKLPDVYIGLNFTRYPEKTIDGIAIDKFILQKAMAIKKDEAVSSRLIIVESPPRLGKTTLCFKLCHDLYSARKEFYFFELRKFNSPAKVAKFIEEPFNALKGEIIKRMEIDQEGKTEDFKIDDRSISFQNAVIILDGLSEMKYNYDAQVIDELVNNLYSDLEDYSQTIVILTSRLFVVSKAENIQKKATLVKINILSLNNRDELMRKINAQKKNATSGVFREDSFFDFPLMPFFLTRSELYFKEDDVIMTRCDVLNILEEIKGNSNIDLPTEDFFNEISKLACILKRGGLKPGEKEYMPIASSFFFDERDGLIQFSNKNLQEYFAAFNVFFELKHNLPYIPEMQEVEVGVTEYEKKAIDALELIYNHFVRYPLSDFGFRCLKSFIDTSIVANPEESQIITKKLKRSLPVFIKHQLLYEYKATLSSSYPLNSTLKGFSTFWALLKHLSPCENFFTQNGEGNYRNSVQDFVDIVKFEKSIYGDFYWDLSFQDLRNVNFRNIYLTRIDFSNSILDGAKFDGSTLDEISFCQASVNDASFVKSVFKFVSAEAVQSALNADFTASYFQETNFSNANLRNSVLVAVRFGNADLRGTNFQYADISNGDFCEASFDERTDFPYANLSKTILNDIRGIDKIQLSKKVLTASEISGIILSGAVFKDANLRGRVICSAQLRACILLDTDLSMACLDGTDLSGAKLNMNSKLDRASLTSANLSGVQENSKLEDLEFVNLLENAKSLFDVTGLSETIIAQLKENKPALFSEPDYS